MCVVVVQLLNPFQYCPFVVHGRNIEHCGVGAAARGELAPSKSPAVWQKLKVCRPSAHDRCLHCATWSETYAILLLYLNWKFWQMFLRCHLVSLCQSSMRAAPGKNFQHGRAVCHVDSVVVIGTGLERVHQKKSFVE
jgi:hypothetical protein